LSRTVKAHVLLILVTFIWGVTFVVIKNAIQDMAPLLFNCVRMVLAAVALVLIYIRHVPRITRATLLSALPCGLFLWAGYEFQTTGLKLTTPSKSGFVTGLSVVLVPVFLAMFWRKRLKTWTWIGVFAALAGLYLLTVPATGNSGAILNLQGINFGDVLTLGCAVSFGFQIIFVGHATRRHAFEQIAMLQAVICAVFMAATLPFAGELYGLWSPRVIWAILITGLLCTAAAFTVQAWAQQFTSPTYTALIFALEPVFAWVTSLVVLHEHLGYRAGVGAVLILAGIIVAEVKGGSDEVAEAA
jgi:drug/metabolite transporter (DMT)-like permease